ncbi:MAG TPA: efflux transporter outer membrane subunit [Acidobacteriota bacterium]|nr:efflux transporter outer membrane subunit [Acidobacteriota bacterium]
MKRTRSWHGRTRGGTWPAAALLGLLVLAGCAKTPAPPQPPDNDIEIPARWSGGEAPQGEVSGSWWTRFGDPRLDALVQEALRANYDLKAAVERLQAASAQARIAGAPLLPGADAGASGSRRRQNFVGFPIPGQEQRVLSTTSSNSGVSLNVSWEADLWGRLRDEAQAALSQVEAGRADVAAVRQSLAAQVAKAWFAVSEARQQVDLAQRTLESYRESAERLRFRYENGVIGPLDLRLALTNVHQTEAQLRERRNQLQSALRQVEILLGRYPAAQIEDPSDLPQVPGLPDAGLPAQMLSRRPDLLASQWRLLSADLRLQSARKDLYPRLSFSTGAGTSGRGLSDVFDPDLFVWNLVGNLTAPLFQGGRIRGQIELEQSRVRELAHQFASDLLTAFAEVETALQADRLLAQREEDLRLNLEQSRGALDLAEFQYRNGVEAYITVLEAQRRALSAETLLLTVRGQRLRNRVDLHLALGGDFSQETSTR